MNNIFLEQMQGNILYVLWRTELFWAENLPFLVECTFSIRIRIDFGRLDSDPQ